MFDDGLSEAEGEGGIKDELRAKYAAFLGESKPELKPLNTKKYSLLTLCELKRY